MCSRGALGNSICSAIISHTFCSLIVSKTVSGETFLDLDLTHCSGSEGPLWLDTWGHASGISEEDVDRGGEHLLTGALISILINTSTWISEDPHVPMRDLLVLKEAKPGSVYTLPGAFTMNSSGRTACWPA